MNLLYQIISEYIDDLITKKKRQVKRLEDIYDVINNYDIRKRLYKLRQDINYLQVAKYKMNEYFIFIQDIENVNN
jgi:hypothetical protein